MAEELGWHFGLGVSKIEFMIVLGTFWSPLHFSDTPTIYFQNFQSPYHKENLPSEKKEGYFTLRCDFSPSSPNSPL